MDLVMNPSYRWLLVVMFLFLMLFVDSTIWKSGNKYSETDFTRMINTIMLFIMPIITSSVPIMTIITIIVFNKTIITIMLF